VAERLVLLHGFGGTRRAWDAVVERVDRERYMPLALDLPGHGSQAQERPITFASCVASVLERSPRRFALCGYSLGGRIAMHVALAAPERVTRLALVSASPGIEDPIERARRRGEDRRLARELEEGDYERFIERWRSQPLFAGDPPRVNALARADWRRNSPAALAVALRGIGAGEMRPLWPRLGELAMGTAVLAGARDKRYVALARRMVELLPAGALRILPGGHVLALESPADLAAAISAGPAPGR
jgi:2-succinyl-6-hydroxy-2,4-cyclohexadiene-1-carboxylate synthase